MPNLPDGAEVKPLSKGQRQIVLAVAFAAWMFAGLEISTFVLLSRPAVINMLSSVNSQLSFKEVEAAAAGWFSWYQCAFLLGAAAGGWIFGALGDRIGRSKSMALSVLCYSVVTGISYFARTPEELLIFRCIACLGIGGVWPNAVSLVSEAWPDVSRPALAGVLGTAANIGFVLMGVIAMYYKITPENWRWVLLVGAAPTLLGIAAWFIVPESPRWLKLRATGPQAETAPLLGEVFRPPLLRLTLIGIALCAVPVVGTAANANWIVPWADQVASQHVGKDFSAEDAAGAKALIQTARSGGAVFGSLLGGWLASLLGRRTAYFAISLATLAVSMYIYHFMNPMDPYFWVAALAFGFFGVTYFGWLPLYLPELFPTHIRSTGSGVTFNFGRIIAAGAALGAALAKSFGGDYGRVGTWTSLIYAVGLVIILVAPDTSQKKVGQ